LTTFYLCFWLDADETAIKETISALEPLPRTTSAIPGSASFQRGRGIFRTIRTLINLLTWFIWFDSIVPSQEDFKS
jgi:hypothetical protein